MDMKIKIVIVLFIVVAVGYAVYFIINDFSKTKKKEKFDRRITETFEDYDVRKHILKELDTYDIDKKSKNDIYETLNKQIEKFKEMPDDQINSFIRSTVTGNKTKVSSRKVEDEEEKIDEKFENSLDSVKPQPVSAPRAPPSDIDTRSAPPQASVASTPQSRLESDLQTVKVAPQPMLGDKDIYKMIESTSTSFNTNLNQIKGMVEAMAKQCQAPPSQSIPKAALPSTTTTLPKSTSTSIEGFENFSGRGYSYL